MKVYVSADMEGVAGVTSAGETNPREPGNPEFARARLAMTNEVNAAIRAAFDAGASDVLVNDSHSTMRNILPDVLDPRARLIRGTVKSGCMMAGLDRSFAAAVLIGCHARAGQDGVLSHTISSKELIEVSVDGAPAGELRLNALLAAEQGVPISLVCGDDVTCDEARALLGVDQPTFETKIAIDRITASSLAPTAACDGIHAAALAALSAPPRPLLAASGPYRLRAEWRSTSAAHVCSWIPGVTRLAPRITEHVSESITGAVDLLLVMLLAASQLELM